jgi:hypothetical protein
MADSLAEPCCDLPHSLHENLENHIYANYTIYLSPSTAASAYNARNERYIAPYVVYTSSSEVAYISQVFGFRSFGHALNDFLLRSCLVLVPTERSTLPSGGAGRTSSSSSSRRRSSSRFDGDSSTRFPPELIREEFLQNDSLTKSQNNCIYDAKTIVSMMHQPRTQACSGPWLGPAKVPLASSTLVHARAGSSTPTSGCVPIIHTYSSCQGTL